MSNVPLFLFLFAQAALLCNNKFDILIVMDPLSMQPVPNTHTQHTAMSNRTEHTCQSLAISRTLIECNRKIFPSTLTIWMAGDCIPHSHRNFVLQQAAGRFSTDPTGRALYVSSPLIKWYCCVFWITPQTCERTRDRPTRSDDDKPICHSAADGHSSSDCQSFSPSSSIRCHKHCIKSKISSPLSSVE